VKRTSVGLITIFSTLIVLCVEDSLGYNIFDMEMPDKNEVASSLKVAKDSSKKKYLTAPDILCIYTAERNIGKYVLGIPLDLQDTLVKDILKRDWQWKDPDLTLECVNYIRANKPRFREVSDGWKGESNFWEPNRFWLEEIVKSSPDSPERKEIEFDLDFREFIRQFDVDEQAKGKSCEQYYDELLKEHGDIYRELYSQVEIAGMVPNCKKTREKFISGRKMLLDKHGTVPFTIKLRDIDPTIIVVLYSIC
jgi:hypothetical protein